MGPTPDVGSSGLLVGQDGSPGSIPGLRPACCPPQVRFSRPESEQARQRRVQSYEFLQKKHAEEPWVHLRYHGLRVSGSLGAAGPRGSWGEPVPRKHCSMASLSLLCLTADSVGRSVIPQGEGLCPASRVSSSLAGHSAPWGGGSLLPVLGAAPGSPQREHSSWAQSGAANW